MSRLLSYIYFIAFDTFLKNNLINTNEIIIDSKSGYSGAGKKTLDTKLYPQIEKNIAIYGHV